MLGSEGLKVRDLVSIEEVEEVVNIMEHKPEERVSTFVADEELERRVKILFERLLRRGEKNSFFIIGGYGSGKSHLLSFIGELLQEPRLWEMVKNEKLREYGAKFKERRFLPVWVSLSGVASREDLGDLLFVRLEETLKERMGKAITLAPFRHYIEAGEKVEGFREFIERKGISQEQWEDMKRANPEEASNLAKEFLDKEGLGLKTPLSVGEIMEEALKVVYEELGEGTAIVFIVDELYDFLRGKREEALARDIAFLRELGEASRTHNFFAIFSLQEDIFREGGANIGREELSRILQRYDKITIPYLNLRKVARERVLRKSEEQVESLRKIYSSLRKDFFPYLSIEEEAFVDLYPVHPAVLPYFERVVRETSPRGALAFLSHKAKEIEDCPHNTFVTPAEMLDEFQEELKLHPQYSPLVNEVLPYFESRVKESMPSEEREWAMKALKTLLILHIAKEEVTTDKLAELIVYRGVEGKVNYDFFAKMMDDLYKNLPKYLSILREGSLRERIYGIRLEGPDVEGFIEKGMRKIGEERLWEEILRFLGSRGLPQADLDEWKEIEGTWRNTKREGCFRFISQEKEDILEEAGEYLKEKDFVLLILRPNLPSSYLPEERIEDERILVWRPADMGEKEWIAVRRFCAILHLLERGDLPEEIRERLKRQMEGAEEGAREILQRKYFREGKVSGLQFLPREVKELVERAINLPLNRAYPKHPQPSSLLERRQLREAFWEGICKGEIAGRVRDYLGVLEEVRMVAEEEGRYAPAEEGILREVGEWLSDKTREKRWASWEELREHFRRPPYGLLEPWLEFITLSLIWRGEAELKDSSGKRRFDRHNIQELKDINLSKGGFYLRKLEVRVSPKARRLAEVLLDGAVRLERKEEIGVAWGRLKDIAEGMDLSHLQEEMENFGEPSLQEALVGKLEEVKGKIEPILGILREKESPDEGFEALGNLEDELIEEFPSAWDTLGELQEVVGKRKDIEGSLDYLRRMKIPIESKLREGRDTLLRMIGEGEVWRRDFWEDWFRKWGEVKREYIEFYTREHEKMVGSASPFFGELQELRESKKWKHLSLLEELNPGLHPSTSEIEAEMKRLLDKRCSSFRKGNLEYSSICPDCSFNPLEPPDLEKGVERVKEMIESTWNKHLENLRRERGRIEEEARISSPKGRENLHKLLEGKEEFQLDEEVMEILRRAMGKLKIVELDTAELLPEGAILKPQDLIDRIREAVNRRLGFPWDENVRIRIKWSK